MIPNGSAIRQRENMKIARKRRKESLRSWASRLDVSVPTLQRMERGDPTVAMGTYATALWLIEKESVLYKHTEVDNDSYVLALEVQKAMARHTRQKEVHHEDAKHSQHVVLRPWAYGPLLRKNPFTGVFAYLSLRLVSRRSPCPPNGY